MVTHLFQGRINCRASNSNHISQPAILNRNQGRDMSEAEHFVNVECTGESAV